MNYIIINYGYLILFICISQMNYYVGTYSNNIIVNYDNVILCNILFTI